MTPEQHEAFVLKIANAATGCSMSQAALSVPNLAAVNIIQTTVGDVLEVCFHDIGTAFNAMGEAAREPHCLAFAAYKGFMPMAGLPEVGQ